MQPNEHVAVRPIPTLGLRLVRHCYQFLTNDWQHVSRDSSPDQGFEIKFRESCVSKLDGWIVSQHREMNLGMGLVTASRVLHEIDIVALCQPAYGILELKNRLSGPPDKNDVIVFFAKILDYICNNPAILRGHLVPIFVSSTPFEQPTLAACLGLGIHPVSPMFRPLPMLLDAANRMSGEIERGLVLLPDDFLAFEDFMLRSNHVARVLAGADANSRFDLYDNLTVAVRSSGDVDVQGLAIEMRALNSECSRLIAVVRGLKQAGGRTL